jgi:hypothetical protein
VLNAKNASRYRIRQPLSRSRRSLGNSLPRVAAAPAVSSVVYIPVAPAGRWDDIAAELRAAGLEIRPAPMPAIGKSLPLPVILRSREV